MEKIVKPTAYKFLNRFEIVMSEGDGSLEKAFPKVKDFTVWKRVAGAQYKKFVLRGDTSVVDFAKAISYLAKRGMVLSTDNIEDTLSLLGAKK